MAQFLLPSYLVRELVVAYGLIATYWRHKYGAHIVEHETNGNIDSGISKCCFQLLDKWSTRWPPWDGTPEHCAIPSEYGGTDNL